MRDTDCFSLRCVSWSERLAFGSSEKAKKRFSAGMQLFKVNCLPALRQ